MTTANANELPDAGLRGAEIALQATSLSRRAADRVLVSNVSLTLKRGEVLGLLGLNGAGKSTTLKMLSGTLLPDDGQITINGCSLSEYPLKARAQLGFLPDQPPLYNAMRVVEYLKLCGRIRGLKGQSLHQRQAAVIEQCRLGDVQTKLISTLSKGFKQRVGLAQAIIHEPCVILLDEPGSGLDPQQQDNMRTLIRSLGKQQAIVFSTHLMSEAKSTCDRIALMHQGTLVADNLAPDDNLEAEFQRATQC